MNADALFNVVVLGSFALGVFLLGLRDVRRDERASRERDR